MHLLDFLLNHEVLLSAHHFMECYIHSSIGGKESRAASHPKVFENLNGGD